MQKVVYLSNSRDYTEQGNINENKYFKQVNKLLNEGWKVAHMTHDVVDVYSEQKPFQRETFVAFVLLEKDDDEKKTKKIKMRRTDFISVRRIALC